MGVATGATVTVTTACGSRTWSAAEWAAMTPPLPGNPHALRDSDLHCNRGGLRVEGLARGAWYYTRTDPPTAVPLFQVAKARKIGKKNGYPWSVAPPAPE